MNKKLLQCIAPGCVLCMGVIFSVISKSIIQHGAFENTLSGVIWELTEGYQIRQVIAALGIFLLGYFIVACLLPYHPAIYIGLSFPTGMAVWCFMSIILLISNIKYCLSVMLVFITGLVCIILIWRREQIKTIKYWAAIRHTIYILSLTLVLSCGFTPIINTYDSHVFIYQFGEMLANQGAICFETVGSCVAVTGINPALMVALARFAGFETIQVFHWLLILSLILCLFCYIEKLVGQQAGSKKSITEAIVICMLLWGMPSFLYVSHMVNSCTYMMVYITIMVLCSWEFSENNIDAGWGLISLFLIWLSFGRLEGGVIAVFLIICMGHLTITKKNMIIITVPMVLLQSIFFVEIIFEKNFSALSTRDNFLSTSAVAVIFLSLVAAVFYICFFEKPFIKGIRKQQPELITIGLFCACLLAGVYYSEKLVINLLAVGHNLEFEYWKYFPHFTGIILAGAIIYRGKVDWWDSVLIGYALLNFAICLGRELPLREGFGDSYNRILCSLVPLTFYVIMKRGLDLRSITT